MENEVQQDLILECSGISKQFPGVLALDGVDFAVRAGEIMALMGENGAGKSTLVKILSGVYTPDEGAMTLAGEEFAPRSPHEAQMRGVSVIHQELPLTPNQTVAENIFLGHEPKRRDWLGRAGLVDERSMYAQADALVARMESKIPTSELVGHLSTADQQLVAIVKALSYQARVLVLDEPTSSLGESEIASLFGILRGLKAQGLSIVFVSHRIEEVLEIGDRITVLRDGRLVGVLSAAEATPDKIVSMMVGRALAQAGGTAESTVGGEVVLEAKGLTRGKAVQNVSFSLHRGEILGFAGLVGAGRTETVRLIFGADRRDGGEIRVAGSKVSIESPRDAIAAGIALVPEDRKTQGLILPQSIRRNIALPSLRRLAKHFFVDGQLADQLVQAYVSRLRIRTPSLDQVVLNLSGGNQQKTVLAKWLATGPRVLILDEPTKGIDVATKAEIYEIMRQLAAQGIGILMISSDLPEILSMSDRILVMCEGRVAGVLSGEEATEEKIMALASGQVSIPS